MESFFSDISPEMFLIIALNIFFMLVLFLMVISTRSKLKKLRTKYSNFMSGLSSESNMEDMLNSYIDKVNGVISKNREIESQINHIERNLMQCVQKVGIVRYNAFENVGSDLSFTVAMLDNNDNGVIISGIYARDSSSTYAKPVLSGKSRYALSAEEMQAIDIAKKMYRERPL